MPENTPEDVPEDAPDDLPEDKLEDVPEDIPEDLQEDVPEDLPEDTAPADEQAETPDDAQSAEGKDSADVAPKGEQTEAPDNDQSVEGEDSADTAPMDEQLETPDDAQPAEGEDSADTAPADEQAETPDDAQPAEGEDSTDAAPADEQAERKGTTGDGGENTGIPTEGSESEHSDRSALDKLSDYMNDHNYGPGDFSTYSKDPAWRDLQKQAFPDYELPPIADTPKEAFDQLGAYMSDHNYGPDDFATYSQDPTWRELQQIAFPDYELPPLTGSTDDVVTPGDGLDTREAPKAADLLLDSMADTSDFNGDPERDIGRAVDYNKTRFGADSPQYQAMANHTLDPYRATVAEKQQECDDYADKVNRWIREMDEQRDPSDPELCARMDNTKALLSENLADYQREVDQAKDDLDAQADSIGVKPENRDVTFVGIGGDKGFVDAYDGIITGEQDGGTCGINFAASALNQQTGGAMTQKAAVKEFLDAGLCDDGSATNDIYDVGGTSALGREEFFDQHGLDCETLFAPNLNLEDMARRLENGESIGLSVHAEDLDSDGLIDQQSRKPQIINDQFGNTSVNIDDSSNHMTTVAGFDRMPDGQISTIYLNDTGGWNRSPNGTHVNRIPVPANKFYAMCQNTTGMKAQFVKKRI